MGWTDRLVEGETNRWVQSVNCTVLCMLLGQIKVDNEEVPRSTIESEEKEEKEQGQRGQANL